MAVVKALPVYGNASGTQSTRRAVKATVYPKSGDPYTGYIIDGRTYKDPQGKERIDYGSRVEAPDGRSYIYNRGVGGVSDYASAISGYQSGMAADIDRARDSRALNDRAVDLGVAQTMRGLNGARVQAEQDMQSAIKDARRAYIEASNPFGAIAQRNDALGLGDSGYAESIYAGLGNEYQSAVSRARSDRDSAMRDITAAISRAVYQGEIEKAQAWAELERELMGYSADMRKSAADMQLSAAKAAVEDERYRTQRQDELEENAYKRARDAAEDMRDDRENAYERALELVKLGVSDAGIAEALGISLQAAADIARRAVEKSGGAASKKSAGSTAKKTQTQAQTQTQPEKKTTAKYTYSQMLRNAGNLAARIEREIRKLGITDEQERRSYYKDAIETAIEEGYITRYIANKITY